MPIKYTLDQVKNNLEKLYDKLEKKGREDGFWVIASRSDFKPLVIEETKKGKTTTSTIVSMNDVKKELLEGKEQYFKNKKLAGITFSIDKIFINNKKEYNEENFDKIKNERVVSIIIDIYLIDSNGKMDTKSNNKWRCIINFTVDDMTKHKLKFSDAEILMRQVSKKLITTVSFSGIDFKDYIKELKKIQKK